MTRDTASTSSPSALRGFCTAMTLKPLTATAQSLRASSSRQPKRRGRSPLSEPRGHAAWPREHQRDLHATSRRANPPDVLASIEHAPDIRAHCMHIGGDHAAPLCHRSAVIHLFGIRSPHEDSKWRCVPMVAECQVTRRFLSLDASGSRESSGQTRPTRGHRCGAADHTTARRSHTDRGSIRRT